MKTKLITALPALLALAGCSAAGAQSTPTVTVAGPTVTVTAGPPTTEADAPLALGKTADLADGATATVYSYKRGVEPRDPNQDAIDVKVCVGAEPAAEGDVPATPTVSSMRWSVIDSDSKQYTIMGQKYQSAMRPEYPLEQAVRWGDCMRGWVAIQGSPAAKMKTVRYTTDNVIMEWKLP